MGYLAATRGARGDYLSSYRGDPGLFGFLKKTIGAGLGLVGKLGIPGISGIAGLAGGLIGGRRAAPAISRMAGLQFAGGGPPGVRRGAKIPGIVAAGQRFFPGGETGYMPRRRRMNVGNVKALRRAMRRQEGFVKLARRALKGSKYTITTRGASRSPRHVHIRESGPGGVTVG